MSIILQYRHARTSELESLSVPFPPVRTEKRPNRRAVFFGPDEVMHMNLSDLCAESLR